MHNRKTWIVDADIARAAGITEHPISKNCRLFLEYLKNNNHEMTANSKILQEWRTHNSIYSRTWLSNMIARKKIKIVKNTIDIDSHIANTPLDDAIKNIALKDSHLVQTSLEHDVTIASGDDTAKNAFCKICNYYIDIKGILWVNPKKGFDEIHESIIKHQKPLQEWFIHES